MSLQDRWIATSVGATAMACLVFQQSPANEALRAAAGFRVLDSTSSTVAVGLVVAVVTIVIDGTTSVFITLGLHADINVVDKLLKWTRENLTTQQSARSRATSLATDAVLTLGVGAGLVVARRHLHDEERSLPEDLGLAATATLFVAAVAGSLGFLAAGGLEHADAVGLEAPARWVVEYGSDWRLWLAVVVLAIGVQLFRVRRSRREPSHTDESQDDA